MSQEAVQEPSAPTPGPVVRLLQQSLPSVELAVVITPLDETVSVQRDDFRQVMETAFRDPGLSFDYLRCQSGVDWYTDLESVYHLYSFAHRHTLVVKVRCPYDDAHVPTVSDLWAAANWLERETHEMYGIVYDGHPDLRPLLTEDGLGYYPLRKTHPLAEIEEWQEDLLGAVEEARRALTAPAEGEAPPPLDEKALKVQMAQKKAAIMSKAREEARARGLSPEDERAAVRAAIDKFEAEMAAAPPPAAPAAAPADSRAEKIKLAQAKAAVITKAREEARAKGMSGTDEREFVAEALKKFAEEQGAAAPPPAAGPAAVPAAAAPQVSRAEKIKLAQAKAGVITKAREEARAKGMSGQEEREFVAEALKKFAQEQGG